MKKNLLLFLLLYFLIMPVMAEDWTLIPNTNVSYDKDSIEISAESGEKIRIGRSDLAKVNLSVDF